jgi:hypothetical protein
LLQDKNPDDRAQAEAKFKDVGEAYEVRYIIRVEQLQHGSLECTIGPINNQNSANEKLVEAALTQLTL